MEDMAARESDNAFAITVRLAAKRALLIRSLVDDGELKVVYLHRLWRFWLLENNCYMFRLLIGLHSVSRGEAAGVIGTNGGIGVVTVESIRAGANSGVVSWRSLRRSSRNFLVNSIAATALV